MVIAALNGIEISHKFIKLFMPEMEVPVLSIRDRGSVLDVYSGEIVERNTQYRCGLPVL